MKRSKLLLSAKWRSFVATGKQEFQQTPTPTWSCVRCRAESGDPNSPALRNITATGPKQGNGLRHLQVDVAGPLRTEQMHKAATASLGRETTGDCKATQREEFWPRCLCCSCPLTSGDAGLQAALYLREILRLTARKQCLA